MNYTKATCCRHQPSYSVTLWYSASSVRVPPRYNFSSTLYTQSCWCIILVIQSL
jgi:hypothetical protein